MFSIRRVFCILAAISVVFIIVGNEKVTSSPGQASSASSESGWTTETVVESRDFDYMTESHMALDANGHPHLAYGTLYLYYSWWDGARWHTETVDDSPGAGAYASLALGVDGVPYISYRNAAGGLNIAHKAGNRWMIETIDDAVIHGTAIAVGSTGPEIGYAAHNALKFAKKLSNGAWNIEIVNNVDARGVSLAYSSGGFFQYYPHLSYCDYSNRRLKYSDRTAGYWKTEDLGWCGVNATTLAIDNQKNPHIIFTNSQNYTMNLRHVYHNSSGWHAEDIVKYTRAYGPSMAFDYASGKIIVSFYDPGDSIHPDTLKLATKTAGGWQIDVVADAANTDSSSTSLALDQNKRPHISYFYDNSLIHTYFDGSHWVQDIVDQLRPLDSSSSLAVDSAGQPHLVYWENKEPDGHLKYASSHNGSWESEDVLQPGWITERALALDKADQPHIAYGLTFGGLWDPTYSIGYARRIASGWWVTTTVAATASDNWASLALDTQGFPWIGYADDGAKVVHWTGITWQTELVDAHGDKPAIAIDGVGHPHLVYSTSEGLRYAYKDGAGWHFQNIGADASCFSLALDSSGQPAVGYWHGTTIFYATPGATGWAWNAQQVQSSMDCGNSPFRGCCPSLAFDRWNHPHLVYPNHSPEEALYHASDDGSGWRIETIFTGQNWGYCEHPSLAIDPYGGLHVSSSYWYETYHPTVGIHYSYKRPQLTFLPLVSR